MDDHDFALKPMVGDFPLETSKWLCLKIGYAPYYSHVMLGK
jgi:hypothetical protein